MSKASGWRSAALVESAALAALPGDGIGSKRKTPRACALGVCSGSVLSKVLWIDHLSPIARDQGTQNRLLDILREKTDGAVAERRTESPRRVAAELGQRLGCIVGQILRLGPRHRLGGFHNHDGVRSPVGK